MGYPKTVTQQKMERYGLTPSHITAIKQSPAGQLPSFLTPRGVPGTRPVKSVPMYGKTAAKSK